MVMRNRPGFGSYPSVRYGPNGSTDNVTGKEHISAQGDAQERAEDEVAVERWCRSVWACHMASCTTTTCGAHCEAGQIHIGEGY